MTALLLLSHESAPRVARMVDYWRKTTVPDEIVVAYGGPAEEFDKIDGRKVFIDDPWLRTRDHQRERQSYTGVLRGALKALNDVRWEWLYLAEYDILPLDDALWERLKGRAEDQGADLLGHRMWRIDDTLHPHYASHLATPQWLEWIGSISRRANKRVVVSCMGCGQFWRREALEEVIAQGEPERAYLELQLPSVAHHLGFRVRGLAEQDRFISNHVIPDARPELLRDTGAWVMHPLKELWSSRATELPVLASRRANGHPIRRPASPPSSGETMEDGWMGDLSGLLKRIAEVATGRMPVRIMRGGQRLAIGLPQNRKAARVVIDLYHPHRLKGRLFRLFVRTVLKLHLERRVLKSQGGTPGTPKATWLRQAAGEGLVGFVGSNPIHGPRCLLGGLTSGDDPQPFVGKLGFDGSREAITREAAVLEQIDGRFSGVLRLLSFETGPDWALLRLPWLGFRTPRGMGDPVVIDLLVQWLGDAKRPLGEIDWAAGLLRRAEVAGTDPVWCERMRNQVVRTALVHGDFAVWNLRLLSTGPCAIDWEWADVEGVAGIDLAHGLRQEAVMICGFGAKRAVDRILSQARSRSWGAYLNACGWDGAHEDWLKLGLLHSHFNAGSDSREMLAVLGVKISVE